MVPAAEFFFCFLASRKKDTKTSATAVVPTCHQAAVSAGEKQGPVAWACGGARTFNRTAFYTSKYAVFKTSYTSAEAVNVIPLYKVCCMPVASATTPLEDEP